MSLMMVVLGALIGCGWSTPEPTQPEPTVGARAKRRPAKRKGKGKSAKFRRGRKAKARRAAMTPVGAAGDVNGTLVLTTLEEPARVVRPAPGPQAEAEGTAEAEPATPMVTRTKAELKLSWGDDGASTVSLGKVRGTCTDAPTAPVGPPGQEKTPLWTVRCIDGERTLDLYILQVGRRISVVRELDQPTPEGAKAFKPVKRIPLVEGAVLRRDS